MAVPVTALPRAKQAALIVVVMLLTACSAAPPASTAATTSPPTAAPSTVASASNALVTAQPTPMPTLASTPAATPVKTAAATATPVAVQCQNPCALTMRDRIPYGTRQIKAGTEVNWTSACFTPCTITFTTIPVDSGNMARGDIFSHTFTEPGSYPYYCQFDPTEMKGTIIVTP